MNIELQKFIFMANNNSRDTLSAILHLLLTFHYLEAVVASWHGSRSMVTMRATRVCRGQWWMLRAGYNYYAAAVPWMVLSVADASGKRYYQDSEYYC
jgi:hypothetical protein